METKQPEKAKKFSLSKKNIQLLIAAALGIVVLILYFSTFSGFGKTTNETQNTYAKDITAQLESIISKIKGVSKAQIVVTFKDNGSIVYAQDKNVVTESKTENGKVIEVQTDTSKIVFVGGKPLIEREILPQVQGVLIVCVGGSNPTVKLEIIKATMTALSIPANLIEVFEANK